MRNPKTHALRLLSALLLLTAPIAARADTHFACFAQCLLTNETARAVEAQGILEGDNAKGATQAFLALQAACDDLKRQALTYFAGPINALLAKEATLTDVQTQAGSTWTGRLFGYGSWGWADGSSWFEQDTRRLEVRFALPTDAEVCGSFEGATPAPVRRTYQPRYAGPGNPLG